MYFLKIFVHWLVSWMISIHLNWIWHHTSLEFFIQIHFSYFIYKIWNENCFDRKLTQYSRVFWPHHFNLYYFLYRLIYCLLHSQCPIQFIFFCLFANSQCVDKICLMSDFNSKRFNVFIVACAIRFKKWHSNCKSLTHFSKLKVQNARKYEDYFVVKRTKYLSFFSQNICVCVCVSPFIRREKYVRLLQ